MTKKISISALKKFADEYGYDHLIMFCTAGQMQYLATYGKTVEQCDQAAQFGDKLKDAMGWPESLHAMPSRVKKLTEKVQKLESLLNSHGIDPSEVE